MSSSQAFDLTVPRLSRVGVRHGSPPEQLAVLLLPARLEGFEWDEHARELLAIPRVIALEPGRFRTPSFLRDTLPLRQAKRLRLPGQPRLLVLYHPAQYPLARALRGRYEQAELWYLRLFDERGAAPELAELDRVAQERAIKVCVIDQADDLAHAEAALRQRLAELDVISHRPFLPGARPPRR